MNRILIISFALLLICSCKSDKGGEGEATNQTDDWIYLFDGSSIDGWRAYNGTDLPPQWEIKDGTLTFDTEKRLESDKQGGKDIIYAKEKFDNFELSLEWKVSKGGNSGIFYHLWEGYKAPYEVSPEYQLLDDLGWEELNNAKLEEWQKAGADYGMYTPDKKLKKLNPAGQWNTSRIVYTPVNAEYWLNGQKLLSFVPRSKDWHERKSTGKWKDFPDYGRFKNGYIGLQDHDSPIWFKNIKIKKL